MQKESTWKDYNWLPETTADGSPTLRFSEEGERMHHSGGAASETEMIYRPVIDILRQQNQPLRFVSVGLGLGYVETLLAREFLVHGFALQSIESFEVQPELREFWKKWIFQEPLPETIQHTYQTVAQAVLAQQAGSKISVVDLQIRLQKWIQAGILQLKFSFDGDFIKTTAKNSIHGFFYDAFSRKTNQQLWEEEFLKNLFAETASENCVVSTYACLGPLKRALIEKNFSVLRRKGFQGKRNSTLAARGVYSQFLSEYD